MEHLINWKSTSFSHPRKNTQVFFPVTALHFIFLTAAVLIFVYFSVPEGKLFGSETDWYCQHVTLVDTMRRQFYATGDLFPDWISLGSGKWLPAPAFFTGGFFINPWTGFIVLPEDFFISQPAVCSRLTGRSCL